VRRIVVALAAAAYCGWVATTTPFTVGSDTAVAVGFAAMVATAGWVRRHRVVTDDPVPASDPERVDDAGPANDSATIVPWLVLAAAVAVVELVAYFAGGSDRAAFPTLSALSDIAERSTAAKAALVAAWLALGWGLLGR